MAIDQIRVNGNLYGWGSIVLKINGDRLYGFSEIAFGDGRERQKGYGQARHQGPRGRSPGKYAPDPVKLKGFADSIQAAREALAALSEDGISYGNVESEIIVTALESGLAPLHVQIERCVISKDSSSFTEGPENLMDELELDTMAIRRNGLTLFDSTGGST